MAKFIIEGQQKLAGSIEVLGAKNACLIMIAASVLLEGKTILNNVPDILDISKIIQILEKLGISFKRDGHQLEIDTTNIHFEPLDRNLVAAIRASIVLVGPILAKFNKLEIPHPGGCTIGSRPIDLHIEAFKKLGVEVRQDDNNYQFFFQSQNQSEQTFEVEFPKISVTATENIILFAVALADKKVVIKNAALEPEVIDLIDFLNKAGAKIKTSQRTIEVTGQQSLKGVEHTVIADRIEAGTFAIMAAATQSSLKITNIVSEHIASLLDKFRQMGVEFALSNDSLYIKNSQPLKAVDIVTAEYPGFATDLQPPMGILLTQAQGQSIVQENIFENRLEYLKELAKMGAQVEFKNSHEAKITGPTPLHGAEIESLDLRAGATLLIAALTASGQTVIQNAQNIDRGYEKIESRLEKIGAKIKRIS